MGALVEARETTFEKLIQGDNQFQIPLYQRTYSWKKSDHDRLWTDLCEQAAELADSATGDHAEGDEPVRHFLGSVVLAPQPPFPDTVQRYVVIDGQQRLTTLMLLACAIRDHVKQVDPRKAEIVHRRYLVNEEDYTGLDAYRLLPTQADRPAYLACVDREPSAGGEDSVGRAYAFFTSELIRYAPGGEWDAVKYLDQALRQRLSLVTITAGARDNVYRIFESLNNTGVPLTQADLLRNYVFMHLPRLGQSVYDKVWLPMQTELGPDRLVTLAWLDLILQGDTRVKLGEVYQGQQRRLSALLKAGGEEALRDDLVRLRRLGSLLLRLLEPDREPDPQLREALVRLREWGGEVHYPLALHTLHLVQEGKATSEEGAAALSLVESFLVRRMICYVRTNNLNRVLYAAPTELESDRPLPEAVQRLLSAPRRYWPSDVQLREAIRQQPFYWQGKPAQRAFVLRRFEESYAAPEPVDFSRAWATIEHVLPQTPTDAWYEMLAQDVEEESGPKELHETLVHTLGNLTLSGENGRLSNHPYERKQQILDQSALRMNREIAGAERWGKTEILDRADRLVERAIRLWPSPLRVEEIEVDERSEWVTLRQVLAGLPAGRWTTYGDLATVIGLHARVVGRHIGAHPELPHAHRVLSASGTPADGFAWPDERTVTQREALEEEGVRFRVTSADPAQRLHAAELAELAGLEPPESTGGGLPANGAPAADRSARFSAQLRTSEGAATDDLLALLEKWESSGVRLGYGEAAETSCAPLFREGSGALGTIWPVTFYPRSRRVEVVLEHLARREPFTRPVLLREFVDRLNTVPGVQLDVADGVLARRRPSFALDLLTGSAMQVFQDVLEWFRQQVT